MTCAGLKSMIVAGLTQDDYRVKAALESLGRHYTFNENGRWMEVNPTW